MNTNYVSQEMETKAIACLLKLPFDKSQTQITKGSFFWGCYKNLFDCVQSLFRKDILHTRDIIIDELQRLGILESIFIYENTDLRGEDAINHLFELDVKLDEYESIYKVVYDYATKRSLKKLADSILASIEEGKQAEDIVIKADKDLAKIAYLTKTRVHSPSITLGDTIRQGNEIIVNSLKGEDYFTKTGIASLDNIIGGIFKSQMVTIAGAQGQGKSALLKTIAENIALFSDKPKKVGIFTLEMPAVQYYFRTLCRLTGIPYKRIVAGDIKEKEWKFYKDAVELLESKKDMIIYDDSPATLATLKSKQQKMIDLGVEIFAIDQLSLIRGETNSGELYQIMDRNSYAIKEMAVDFNVTQLLAQQMNRGGTKQFGEFQRDPVLQDLAQAGENAPNLVIMFKHWYNKEVKHMIDKSCLYIVKNRDGENTVELPVYFDGLRFNFRDLTENEKELLDAEPNFVEK